MGAPMNETTAVAKKPEKTPPQPVEGPDGVTTWKCYQRIAKTLRLIGAHMNLKQEAVLELFEEEFENYLVILQAQDMAKRKRGKPE